MSPVSEEMFQLRLIICWQYSHEWVLLQEGTVNAIVHLGHLITSACLLSRLRGRLRGELGQKSSVLPRSSKKHKQSWKLLWETCQNGRWPCSDTLQNSCIDPCTDSQISHQHTFFIAKLLKSYSLGEMHSLLHEVVWLVAEIFYLIPTRPSLNIQVFPGEWRCRKGRIWKGWCHRGCRSPCWKYTPPFWNPNRTLILHHSPQRHSCDWTPLWCNLQVFPSSSHPCQRAT